MAAKAGRPLVFDRHVRQMRLDQIQVITQHLIEQMKRKGPVVCRPALFDAVENTHSVPDTKEEIRIHLKSRRRMDSRSRILFVYVLCHHPIAYRPRRASAPA